MKLLLIFMLSLLMIEGCEAQTRLPAEMPENITVYLNQSGGMRRAYKKITIDEGVLEFEELRGGQQTSQKWSAKVSPADLAKLYRTFVENRFDEVKNDERKGIVYDAGSESIAISLNKLKSFRVAYGKNSPLSGVNLERYQAVRTAIYDLMKKYENEGRPSGDADRDIQGTWRVEGENGGRSWYLEWTFDNGSFQQKGYPPLFQEGKYRVLRAGDDKITLELFDQKGNFGEGTREMQIVVDKEENQLTISGTRGFSRTKTVKND